MPTLTPQDFVSKWKRELSREKQTEQQPIILLGLSCESKRRAQGPAFVEFSSLYKLA